MLQPQEEITDLGTGSGAGDASVDRSERERARTPEEADRPPITNRGVCIGGHHAPDTVKPTENCHRFDYYRCTPLAEYSELKTVLQFELSQTFGEVRLVDGGPARHYTSNEHFVDEHDNVVCELLSGGKNVRPNVLVRGKPSDAVAAILRANWQHGPSRVDPCIDVAQEGLFEHLRAWTDDFAAFWNVKRRIITNDSPDEGDTIYLGSRSSQVFLRIYQPGLKRAQEEGRAGAYITALERATVRIEMEFKPGNPRARKVAATLAPEDFWACSRWSADFAKKVLAMDVQPVSVSMRRESNRDRALRFMCQQYRAHLSSLLTEHEGDIVSWAEDLGMRAGFIQPWNPDEDRRS